MQQQAAIMAAATAQGTYLASPIASLAAHVQSMNALGAPNGITTAAITPTTGTLANGEYLPSLFIPPILVCVYVYNVQYLKSC